MSRQFNNDGTWTVVTMAKELLPLALETGLALPEISLDMIEESGLSTAKWTDDDFNEYYRQVQWCLMGMIEAQQHEPDFTLEELSIMRESLIMDLEDKTPIREDMTEPTKKIIEESYEEMDKLVDKLTDMWNLQSPEAQITKDRGALPIFYKKPATPNRDRIDAIKKDIENMRHIDKLYDAITDCMNYTLDNMIEDEDISYDGADLNLAIQEIIWDSTHTEEELIQEINDFHEAECDDFEDEE